jgi:hypothetical protein
MGLSSLADVWASERLASCQRETPGLALRRSRIHKVMQRDGVRRRTPGDVAQQVGRSGRRVVALERGLADTAALNGTTLNRVSPHRLAVRDELRVGVWTWRTLRGDILELERGRSLSTGITSPAQRVAASMSGRLRPVTGLARTTPRRMATLLAASILAAILMSLIVFATYASINDTVTVVGKDAAPSIVAADHLQALAASADANALNAVVTHSAPDAYSWSQYRKDIRASYEELTTASQYTTYGFEQIGPIQTMASMLSEYDNEMGQLQVQTAANLATNPIAGHTILVQNILPERLALVQTDYSHLNQKYAAHRDAIGPLMALVWIAFLLLLGVFVGTQVYLFRHTQRIINLGYATATVITLGCMIFMLAAFSVGESQLAMAKQQSFDSINALWSVRATAFIMNADESLYVLDAQNPQTLAAVEGDFTHYQHQIVAIDPQQAVADAKKGVAFKGYLGQQLSHMTYPGEGDAVRAAIQTFANYIAIDQQVRQLLAAGNVQQAQSLVLGFNPGQAALAFTQFDSSVWNAIDINQFQFDQQIDNAFGRLGPVPYVLGVALLAIIVATIFGMKPRLDEYTI